MAGYLEDVRTARLQGREPEVLPEEVAAAPKSLPLAGSADNKDSGVGPTLLGQKHCTKALSKIAREPEQTTRCRGPIAATPFEQREPFAYTLWAALAAQAAFTLLVAHAAECVAPLAMAAVGTPVALTLALAVMLCAQAVLSQFRHVAGRGYLLVAKTVAEGVSWGFAANVAGLPMLGPLLLGIWAASLGTLGIVTYTGILTMFGWIVEPAPEWQHASKTWLMNPADQDKRGRSGLRKFRDMSCDEEGGFTRATCWFALFAWMFSALSAFAAVADNNPKADFGSIQVASVVSLALLAISVHGVEKQLRRCLPSECVSAVVNVNNDFLHAVLAACTLTLLANPMEEAGGLAKPLSLFDAVFLDPNFLAAMEAGRQAAAQMQSASHASGVPAAAAGAGQLAERDHVDSETEGLLRSVFRRRWPQQAQCSGPSV